MSDKHNDDFDSEEHSCSSSSSCSSDSDDNLVARTPEETQVLFGEAFVRGDIDALVSLYEKDAVLVVAPGVIVTGRDAIRQALTDLRAQFVGTPTFTLTPRLVLKTDDVALLISDVVLSGVGQNGQPFTFTGTTTDVVHRHHDKWLVAIDNPFGVAAAPPA